MLTPAQRQALDLACHTAIVANAGSGKTKVLVERYLAILLAHRDYHPRDLVAITFTEQAARDLKRKIFDEIETRLSAESDTNSKLRLFEIRSLLGSAQISTIHAFCNQLLRAYPVEANVDASFGILAPPADRMLLDESIRAVFFRILQIAYSDEGSFEASFLPLFRTLGRNAASEAMRSMVGKRAVAVDLAQTVRQWTNDELEARWKSVIHEYLSRQFLDNIDMEWYRSCLKNATTKKAAATAREALALYVQADDLDARVSAGLKLLTAFHTGKWSKLASDIVPKDRHEELEESILPVLDRLHKARNVAEAYCDHEISAEFSAMYAGLMRQLVLLFELVMEEYESTKLALGLIDYDDSLVKVLALVDRSDIAAELAARYKHILVDEYQDTDPLQYRIIERITAGLGNTNTLVIVGDPKQAIYGFRNAELPLFFNTVESIRRSSRSQLVGLQENFRILPAPLAFVNKVFTYIFEKLPSSNGQDYLPLIQARPAGASGTVEFIIGADKDADPEALEAELIARKILHLTRESSVEAEHGFRPAQYGDIAILLRSRLRQKEFEHTLHRHNIPFTIFGGSGFYAQQEILDITTYLQFLLNPTDDVALAGILRSPFFALDDADLLKIAIRRGRTKQTLWQTFESIYHSSDSSAHWERAYSQINENLSLVGRLSAYQLINKVYDETKVLGTYSQLQSGKQAIANLEKFAAMALVNESAAFFGTYDFVERIMLLADQDEDEVQAVIRTDDNTVQIMTIHAAKGLEFPIVILPQLERNLLKGDSGRTEVLLDRELGAFMRIRDRKSQHWIYHLAQRQKRERELEEEQRILYVGMTRARDHLLLSATVDDKRPPENSYLRWIEDALGIDLSGQAITEIEHTVQIETYADGQTSKQDVALRIPVTRSLELPEPVAEPATHTKKTLPPIDLKTILPSQSRSRYSPTQLLHYRECPTKYYLRYVLGLPEEATRWREFEPAELGELVKGTVLGQLVHFVLERGDEVMSSGQIDIQKFDETLRLGLEYTGLYDDLDLTRYRDSVLQHVTSFLSSKLGKEVLAAKEYYAELNLRTMLNEYQMLSGIIDRLYKTSAGAWEILDYKTDTTAITEKKLDRYRFQMRCYAYLVSRFDKSEAEEIIARLFFTHHGIEEKFVFTKEDLLGVSDELNLTVAQIRQDQEAKSLADIERNYEHCVDCTYYSKRESRCIADKQYFFSIT